MISDFGTVSQAGSVWILLNAAVSKLQPPYLKSKTLNRGPTERLAGKSCIIRGLAE